MMIFGLAIMISFTPVSQQIISTSHR